MRLLLVVEQADYVLFAVDGGAWRTGSGQAGGGFEYPDTLLSDEPFSSILAKSRL
jgi:hypothetical protein